MNGAVRWAFPALQTQGILATMSITAKSPPNDLLALPVGMGKRYELIAGELREMSPSGWRHGLVVDRIHALYAYIREHDLGWGFVPTGFLIARDPILSRHPTSLSLPKSICPAKNPLRHSGRGRRTWPWRSFLPATGGRSRRKNQRLARSRQRGRMGDRSAASNRHHLPFAHRQPNQNHWRHARRCSPGARLRLPGE